jgi:putative acetyltransferase
MINLKIYSKELQKDIEQFFETCFTDLGWGYDPNGRHADIPNTEDIYTKKGCRMWCLYEYGNLIGTVAVKEINIENGKKIAELKRLYVLKEFQGKGYGRLLFEKALSYARENNYDKIRLDTTNDRSAVLHLINKYGFNKIPKYNDNNADLFFVFLL